MLKRRLAILCGLCFVVAFLSATAYVAYRSSHKCIGKGCVACRQIENVLHLSNQERAGSEPGASLPPVFFFFFALLLLHASHLSTLTPIALKVKLSC